MRLKMMAVSFTALALLAPTTGTAGPTAASVVKPTDFNTWNPSAVRITKGQRVVWKNNTFEPHSVKSYKGKWMPLVVLDPENPKVGKRFRKTGRYFFRCTFHSTLTDGRCAGMCGKVRVRRPTS